VVTNGLPISETFLSIQGEGVRAGVPSFFIRVSGCNLRCRWCDTPYASWNPEGSTRTVAKLLAEADGVRAGTGVDHAVLTGGEPMIFEQLGPLTRGLRERGWHLTIETAGTVDRDDVACDLMSISPKLANSTPVVDARDPSGAWAARHDQRRVNVGVLRGLCGLDRTREWDRQLKFVVAGEDDLAEVEALLGRIGPIAPGDVLLMPEGVSPAGGTAVGTRAWVVGACVARGWRYCHRVHIEVFGNRRGT
jgi:7-carboxy-7-deazaguanine synthase